MKKGRSAGATEEIWIRCDSVLYGVQASLRLHGLVMLSQMVPSDQDGGMWAC